MKTLTLLFPLLLVAAFAAGHLTLADEEAPKTVKVQKYRLIFAEGALDLSHGGGRWVDGLFLPESKVAAMLVYQTNLQPDPPHDFVTQAHLYAFPAKKPQNDLTGLDAGPSPIEEIDIPADLAQEIVALAELTRRQRAEWTRLGSAVEKRLGWKELPHGE